jgi:hypothetical protein
VTASRQSNGTALGAALLWRWTEPRRAANLDLVPVEPLRIAGLDDYLGRWYAAVRAASTLEGVS